MKRKENNKPSYDHSATGGNLNYSCNLNLAVIKLESKGAKPDLKSQRQAATEDIAKLAQAGPLRVPGSHTVNIPPRTDFNSLPVETPSLPPINEFINLVALLRAKQVKRDILEITKGMPGSEYNAAAEEAKDLQNEVDNFIIQFRNGR